MGLTIPGALEPRGPLSVGGPFHLVRAFAYRARGDDARETKAQAQEWTGNTPGDGQSRWSECRGIPREGNRRQPRIRKPAPDGERSTPARPNIWRPEPGLRRARRN